MAGLATLGLTYVSVPVPHFNQELLVQVAVAQLHQIDGERLEHGPLVVHHSLWKQPVVRGASQRHTTGRSTRFVHHDPVAVLAAQSAATARGIAGMVRCAGGRQRVCCCCVAAASPGLRAADSMMKGSLLENTSCSARSVEQRQRHHPCSAQCLAVQVVAAQMERVQNGLPHSNLAANKA